MRINVMSVMVDDQAKALRFYTEVLGFEKKREIPLGDHSWLTVVAPDVPDGTELSLEPDEHPAARPFKQALVEDGPVHLFCRRGRRRRIRPSRWHGSDVHSGANRYGHGDDSGV